MNAFLVTFFFCDKGTWLHKGPKNSLWTWIEKMPLCLKNHMTLLPVLYPPIISFIYKVKFKLLRRRPMKLSLTEFLPPQLTSSHILLSLNPALLLSHCPTSLKAVLVCASVTFDELLSLSIIPLLCPSGDFLLILKTLFNHHLLYEAFHVSPSKNDLSLFRASNVSHTYSLYSICNPLLDLLISPQYITCISRCMCPTYV